MSLMLGRIGRRVLQYSIDNPQSWVNRKTTAIGEKLHKYSNLFTPTLSRETFRLWNEIERGKITSQITVEQDGFYVDESKLAGNRYVSEAFSRAGITQIDPNKISGPEELANLPREKTFSMIHSLVGLPLPLMLLSTSIKLFSCGTEKGFLAAIIAACFTLLNTPAYKIGEWIVNRPNRNWPRPSLLEAEQDPSEIFVTSTASGGGYALRAMVNRVFIGDALDKESGLASFFGPGPLIFHEKVHNLGGSECEAWDKTNIYEYKLFMSGRLAMWRFGGTLIFSFGQHLAQLFISIYYALIGYTGFFQYFYPFKLMAQRGGKEALLEELKNAEVKWCENLSTAENNYKKREELIDEAQKLFVIYGINKQDKAALQVLSMTLEVIERWISAYKQIPAASLSMRAAKYLAGLCIPPLTETAAHLLMLTAFKLVDMGETEEAIEIVDKLKSYEKNGIKLTPVMRKQLKLGEELREKMSRH